MLVIGQPMEHRVGEDRVHTLPELELGEVRNPGIHPVAELLARLLDHSLRGVHGDDAGARLDQFLCHPTGPAAGVQDGLAGLGSKALDHLARPLDLWVRDTVVDLGVPLPRSGVHLAHSDVVTGPLRSRSDSYRSIASAWVRVTPMSSRPSSRRRFISS